MYVIHLLRKPREESSTVKNLLALGTGALNIDACRLPNDDKPPPPNTNVDTWKAWKDPAYNGEGEKYVFKETFTRRYVWNPKGRFPANTILTHQDKCVVRHCVEGCPVLKFGEKSHFFKGVNTPKEEICPDTN